MVGILKVMHPLLINTTYKPLPPPQIPLIIRLALPAGNLGSQAIFIYICKQNQYFKSFSHHSLNTAPPPPSTQKRASEKSFEKTKQNKNTSSEFYSMLSCVALLVASIVYD